MYIHIYVHIFSFPKSAALSPDTFSPRRCAGFHSRASVANSVHWLHLYIDSQAWFLHGFCQHWISILTGGLAAFLIFPYIGNVIIPAVPTDFHIFQRARCTTNQILTDRRIFWGTQFDPQNVETRRAQVSLLKGPVCARSFSVC